MICAGLSIGFSVNELADIFSERNGGGAPCHRVRKLAAEKLAVLEGRLRELQSWRRELRSTLSAWDRMLVKTPRGKQARLLQRPLHAIWVAEFTNGESYETDSFDRAHRSICPIKPETGIED